MPPAIAYAEGVTPAVADFIMVQAGASISVDEVYKKLFDRVVAGGDLTSLPAPREFDPRFWPGLLSVLQEIIRSAPPATEDAAKARSLHKEIIELRKLHSKRMSWRRWDAKVSVCVCLLNRKKNRKKVRDSKQQGTSDKRPATADRGQATSDKRHKRRDG